MNTILRNLFYTLKRFQAASALNLLGMSSAFAAFILILMKVSYEYTFDTCYQEPERLAVLKIQGDYDKEILPTMPRAIIEDVIRHTPGVAHGTVLSINAGRLALYTSPQDISYIQERIYPVGPDFIQTTGLTLMEGDENELESPGTVLISESQARKFFPKGNAVGSYLHIKDKEFNSPISNELKICGVYKDFPENAQFENTLYTRIQAPADLNDYSQNYYAFLRLRKGVSYEELNRQLAAIKIPERIAEMYSPGSEATFYAFPIQDVYYHTKPWAFFKTGDRQNACLLIGIAILIIATAAINLVNFSTALAPMRIRSINTQKVLGSPDCQLRLSLIMETVCLTMVSWGISLFIVYSLSQTRLLSLIGFTPSFGTYPFILLASGLIALLTGAVAGIYPARYMTSFPPALVLKGNYALSGKGKSLRTALVCLQYVVSFILIVCAAVIYLQNRHMKQNDVGFDRDAILIATLPPLPAGSPAYISFEQSLAAYPEFKGVAYADAQLGANNAYSMTTFPYEDTRFYYFTIGVSPSFCKVMGLKLLEGRDFLPADTAKSTGTRHYLATKQIRDSYRIPTEKLLVAAGKSMIVGYVDDVTFTSNHYSPFQGSPYMFCVNQTKYMPYAYIRVAAGSDPATALSHIRAALEKTFKGYTPDVSFFNAVYARLYEQETNQQYMVTLFSLLAIIISLVGVFGLTIFETAYRRKEIGLRKVYGATTRQILWAFNRDNLKTACICSLIAGPIAYCFMDRWLQDFSVRIAMPAWVFAGAFLLVCLFTSATITLQSYRAANSNPINSIKSE